MDEWEHTILVRRRSSRQCDGEDLIDDEDDFDDFKDDSDEEEEDLGQQRPTGKAAPPWRPTGVIPRRVKRPRRW